MSEFAIWFLTFFIAVRWIALGFVISKHGEEKKVEKYNAWAHLLTTILWCVVAYSVYLNQ